jgi:UDP-2,3-diacylglucosamine pyrophosphatase LpxH
MKIVVSDLHIGDRRTDKQLGLLLTTLESLAKPENLLFLNGDTFDENKYGRYDSRHTEFLSATKNYHRIYYIEGNHDWGLTAWKGYLGRVQFMEAARFSLGSRRALVLHGHQADWFCRKMPRFDRFCITLNQWAYEQFGINLQNWLQGFNLFKKYQIDRQIERLVLVYKRHAPVIIAGHTHTPCIQTIQDVTYINTGTWVDKKDAAYLVVDKEHFELARI